MGYSLSWAALKSTDPESVHQVLGLGPTGEAEEIAESAIVGAHLPNEWCLVQFNRTQIDDKLLERLSLLGEVVFCFVEDHVMFSTASGWLAGSCRWSVTHDCEKGRYHLQVDGQAPHHLIAIQQRLTSEQDASGGEKSDTDYIYDIPAELARELTGYRHDQEIPGASGKIFQVLAAKRKKWKLFRRLG